MQRKIRMRTVLLLFVLCLFAVLSVTVSAQTPDGKIVVVLDAGHGGHDGGTDAGIRTEKEYNLLIAAYLAEELSADDRFHVVMTRTDDTYLKFLPRVLTAAEANADVLISLHCNSSSASYVHGNMAYCSVIERFDAGELAGKLLDAISDAVPIARGDIEYVEDTGDSLGVYYWNDEKQWDMPGAWQLGKKSDYYSINTWSSKFGIPSVIVEHGYLSNKNEAGVIDQDKNLRAMAKAQADAIVEYYTDHTHTFGEREIDFPSNCTLTGTSSRRCTVCGIKTETEKLAPAPDAHYWRRTASAAATCTEDGFADYTCQIAYNLNDKGYACEVHTYHETFTAPGHDYIVTEDRAAGHGTDGVHTEVCRTCWNTVSTTTPGEAHTYAVTETVSPTCTEAGKTVHTCSVCMASYEETIPAPGHAWTQTESVEPTPLEDGYVRYRCAACGEEKTEIISSCPHTFVRETAEPTCTQAGRTTETCSLCGYAVEEILPAPGHDYVQQMNVASTCAAAGFYKGKCSRCGHVITQTRATLPHDFETVSENRLERVVRCTVCGHEHTETKAHPDAIPFLPVLLAALIVLIPSAGAAVILVLNRKHKQEQAARRNRYFEYYEDGENVKK
ncbi:MAG: N-acetylmuramoyl-L-alanine amidase [Clostridia bacterium]|nr:N-acetylmuramoyl-L-alanine amidase [Clostridia bacterium]